MSSQYIQQLFPDDYKKEWQISFSYQGYLPVRSKPLRLYLITLWIELFISAQARLLFYSLIMLLPMVIFSGIIYTPNSPPIRLIFTVLQYSIYIGGLIVGYGPIAMSIISYFDYGGGRTLTRSALGARGPSTREVSQIKEALYTIIASEENAVRGLSGIYMIDTPSEYLYLIGSTLYISSGSLRSQHFEVMLAHELGHNYAGDGSTILALRRLIFPLFYVFIGNVRDFSTSRPNTRDVVPERPNLDIKMPDLTGIASDPEKVFFSMVNSLIFFLLSIAGGGLGVWITSHSWAKYFRERDYLADEFVVKQGMKEQLIEYLEEKRFYDTSVPYMLNWQPANEQRIDRILWLFEDSRD